MPKAEKKPEDTKKDTSVETQKNKSAKKKSVKKRAAKKVTAKKKSTKKVTSKKATAKKIVVKKKTAEKNELKPAMDKKADKTVADLSDSKIEAIEPPANPELTEKDSGVGADEASLDNISEIVDRRFAKKRGIGSYLLFLSVLLVGSAVFAGFWVEGKGSKMNGEQGSVTERLSTFVSESLNSVRDAVGVERDVADAGTKVDSADTAQEPVAVLSGVVDTGRVNAEITANSEPASSLPEAPVAGQQAGGTEEHATQESMEEEISLPASEETVTGQMVPENAAESINNAALAVPISNNFQPRLQQNPNFHPRYAPMYRQPLPPGYYGQQPRQAQPYGGYRQLPYPRYYGLNPYYPVYRQAPPLQKDLQNPANP